MTTVPAWWTRWSGTDIREARVYGELEGSDRRTVLVAGKARRRDELEIRLAALDDGGKAEFSRQLFIWRRMLHMHLLQTDHLLLWFDNSAIQAVLQSEKPTRTVHFASLLALLIFLEDYCFVDAVCHISPVTVFEANYLRPVRSREEALQALGRIAGAMQEIGLETASVGFGDTRELASRIRALQADARTLRKAIDGIDAQSWRMDKGVHGRLGVPLPLSVAEEAVPSARMRYFAPWYAKFILMYRIVTHLDQQNAHWPAFRTLCRQELQRKAVGSIVSRPRKRGVDDDGLSGLGDIDLYSNCELNSQSVRSRLTTNFAVSFDETLNLALLDRLQLQGHETLTFRGGQTDPSAFSRAFVYEMWRSQRRDEKLRRREREFERAFGQFARELLANVIAPDERDTPAD